QAEYSPTMFASHRNFLSGPVCRSRSPPGCIGGWVSAARRGGDASRRSGSGDARLVLPDPPLELPEVRLHGAARLGGVAALDGAQDTAVVFNGLLLRPGQ